LKSVLSVVMVVVIVVCLFSWLEYPRPKGNPCLFHHCIPTIQHNTWQIVGARYINISNGWMNEWSVYEIKYLCYSKWSLVELRGLKCWMDTSNLALRLNHCFKTKNQTLA
jgi:hypothetical protein